MSALDELIYDRTQADVTYAAELNRKLGRGEALTAQELADWNAGLKGAYNASDMNRVDAAVRELGGMLTEAGYPVEYVDPRKLTSSGAGLPEGYTQVEYIESDGTQYIDTGYKANQDTRVVFDAYILQTTTTATGLLGCRQAMGSNGFYIYEQNSDLGEYNDGYGSLYTKDIPLSASARHIIDKDKNKTYIDETIAHTYAAQTFTSPVTLTLFAVQQSNGVDERMSVCRLYSCVIYDNGTIVRNYIPCTNASGIAGLYDTVSGVFYTNAGTGNFTAGADVAVAPKPEIDEWVVGDIINQTVWTQYIVNVQSIRDAYYTMSDTPELPEPTAPLTYDGANAIERLIYDILKLYEGMIKRYRICGTFLAGSDYNRQYIRSV